MIPLVDLSHFRERAKSFEDDQDRTVPEQLIRQSRAQLDAELDVPFALARRGMNFRPGARLVASNMDGGEYSVTRRDIPGRVELGLDYHLGSNVSLSFDRYYSGIGPGKHSSYGAGLDLKIDF